MYSSIFMYCNVWCNKKCAVQINVTCGLTCIIHINNSRTQICRFTVLTYAQNSHISPDLVAMKSCKHTIVHTCRASMNCRVPDLAMVPRLLTRSALVIPIPVSMTVKVLSSLFGMIVIFISFSESNTDGSVRLWYRILSNA